MIGAAGHARLRAAIFGWMLLLGILSAPVSAEAPLVFAAASVKDGLDAVLARYQSETGVAVAVSYAGTPVLARQIEAGAPAQLLLSADSQWMDYLQQRSLLLAGTRADLLGNELVLVSASVCADGPSRLLDQAVLGRWLGGDGKIAIAHPATVPAGRYAAAALRGLNLWSGLQGRLAEVENVRLGLKLAVRGEVPLAAVYASDALVEPGLRTCYRFDPTLHPPIRYPLAALGSELAPATDQLLRYLRGPVAAALWVQHGFRVLEQPGSGDRQRAADYD